jgi:hypothetical protein
MTKLSWMSGLLLVLAGSGCESIRGPGIEFTAPRVSGRVVAAASGEPLAGVRAGRELFGWKAPLGGLRKGAEELQLLQRETRTAADGGFVLPSERVALLFGFGDGGFDLRLAVQGSGFRPWQTNYPFRALRTNGGPTEPRLEAGEIRLERR